MTFIPTVVSNVSVGNSTTSNLSPNTTFTGAVEDVSLYASVSVSYYVQPANATGNIFVQFSNVASPFYPVSNIVTPVTGLTANGFTLDTTMTAQFLRVSYANDSTNQTKLMIQTIYHPQARIAVKSDRLAIPMNNFSDLLNTRSVIAGQTQGNNPTVEILGTNGNQSLNVCINDPRTAYNEISVAQTYPLAQIDFVYGIANTITTSNTFSNATVTASSGLLNVTSNGAVGASSSLFNAKKFVKYRAGQGAQGRMTALFSQPAKVNGSIAVAGLGFAVANTTYMIDFCGFGYGNVASCGQFGILWRRNGNDTFIPQTSWNQDAVDGTTKSGLTLNPQALNSWQIQFQYCGNILFYLENPFTGRFVLVHSIPTNLLAPTIPNFQNPTLQLMWYSNSVSTSSNTLSVFGASGGHFLEGVRNLTGPRGAIVSAPVANLVLNTETMLFALKNSTYYGANQALVIPNRSQIHLRALTVSAQGQASTPGKGSNNDIYFSPAPATIVFKQIRAPNNAPTVWTPYSGGVNLSGSDGSNIYGVSTVSSNLNQITNLTGGNTGFTVTIPCGGGTSIIDLEPYESVLYPGDVICWTANVISQFSTSNVNVAASLTWQEDL
jgi:hypothetical protein